MRGPLCRVCYPWPKPPEAFMAQLTYDELRLLRQLERGDQTISDNQPRGGLDRLVDEGYVIRRLLNPSQTVHSITAKGRAAVHEAEARLHKLVICGPWPERRGTHEASRVRHAGGAAAGPLGPRDATPHIGEQK